MARGRPKKNPSIASAVIAPVEQIRENAAKPVEREPRDMNEYLGVAAKVAKSTIYCGNWKFKNAEKHFPLDPLLRTVEKYFPYAEGGPLFVDRPYSDQDEAECVRKRAAILKEGQRYLYITPEMTFHEAIAQLEGQ